MKSRDKKDEKETKRKVSKENNDIWSNVKIFGGKQKKLEHKKTFWRETKQSYLNESKCI